MAASCRLRCCCAVTAAAAEGDLRLPNPRLARSEKDRIKRRPIALPRGQGSGESAPWWRHTRVLARGHAAQGESRCVSQTGSYVTRVTGIARPVSDTVSGHHKSRYFPFKTGDPRWLKAPTPIPPFGRLAERRHTVPSASRNSPKIDPPPEQQGVAGESLVGCGQARGRGYMYSDRTSSRPLTK